MHRPLSSSSSSSYSSSTFRCFTIAAIFVLTLLNYIIFLQHEFTSQTLVDPTIGGSVALQQQQQQQQQQLILIPPPLSSSSSSLSLLTSKCVKFSVDNKGNQFELDTWFCLHLLKVTVEFFAFVCDNFLRYSCPTQPSPLLSFRYRIGGLIWQKNVDIECCRQLKNVKNPEWLTF